MATLAKPKPALVRLADSTWLLNLVTRAFSVEMVGKIEQWDDAGHLRNLQPSESPTEILRNDLFRRKSRSIGPEFQTDLPA